MSEDYDPLKRMDEERDCLLKLLRNCGTSQFTRVKLLEFLDWHESYRDLFYEYLSEYPYPLDVSHMNLFDCDTMLKYEIVQWLNTRVPRDWLWFGDHMFFKDNETRMMFRLTF